MEELQNAICYVRFVFMDGTHQTIRTTLNPNILLNYGATLRNGYLYDIRHAEYVKLRDDAVTVEVTAKEPESEGVLFNFADRFI